MLISSPPLCHWPTTWLLGAPGAIAPSNFILFVFVSTENCHDLLRNSISVRWCVEGLPIHTSDNNQSNWNRAGFLSGAPNPHIALDELSNFSRNKSAGIPQRDTQRTGGSVWHTYFYPRLAHMSFWGIEQFKPSFAKESQPDGIPTPNRATSHDFRLEFPLVCC